jgi:hypothetical protein
MMPRWGRVRQVVLKTRKRRAKGVEWKEEG